VRRLRCRYRRGSMSSRALCLVEPRPSGSGVFRATKIRWHFLYFLPLPQGHGSLRAVFRAADHLLPAYYPSPLRRIAAPPSRRSFLRCTCALKSSMVDSPRGDAAPRDRLGRMPGTIPRRRRSKREIAPASRFSSDCATARAGCSATLIRDHRRAGRGARIATAVLSAVDRILFRSLPFRDDGRHRLGRIMTPARFERVPAGGRLLRIAHHPGPFAAVTSFQAGSIPCDLTEQTRFA